jgi:hypothetical protein
LRSTNGVLELGASRKGDVPPDIRRENGSKTMRGRMRGSKRKKVRKDRREQHGECTM